MGTKGTHAQTLRVESREKLQQSEEEADDLWVADRRLATKAEKDYKVGLIPPQSRYVVKD